MPNPHFDAQFLAPDEAILSNDHRLVDILDGLLDKGVVVRGELTLSVAGVDLVFLGVDLVLANPDTIRPDRAGQ